MPAVASARVACRVMPLPLLGMQRVWRQADSDRQVVKRMRLRIEEGRSNGLLTHKEYLKKVRALTPMQHSMTVPMKMKGGLAVRSLTGLWSPIAGGFGTCKEAKDARTTVEHGDNEADWAWCPNSHGHKGNYICNMHLNCPVQMRAVRERNGTWTLKVLEVAHTTEQKPSRVAHGLPREEENALRAGLAAGHTASRVWHDANDASMHRVRDKRSEAYSLGPDKGMSGAPNTPLRAWCGEAHT